MTSQEARSRFSARHHQLHRIGRTQDLPSSWGILPAPLPCSQTPAGLAGLALMASLVLPPLIGI